MKLFLAAAFGWLAMVARFGYLYGSGDHVELLPYILHHVDPSLYPNDFYVQGMTEISPNERMVFIWLMSLFHPYLEMATLILHFLSTVILFLGLSNIASRFLTSGYAIGGSILAGLYLFYDWALGGVELYYSAFQASNLAKAMAAWAIVALLDRQYNKAAVLLSIITFIQLLVGLDLMITLGLILAVLWLNDRKIGFRSAAIPIAIYSATALVFLVYILLARDFSDASISEHQFFEILYVFRHPHHFIFSTFPVKKVVFFFGLSILALLWFRKRSRMVYLFVLTSLAVLIGYILFVDVFRISMIANFQWYKMTIWIKFFGFVALFGVAESLLPGVFYWLRRPGRWATLAYYVIGMALIVGPLTLRDPPLQFPGMASDDPLIEISKQVEAQTPLDATFVQPFDADAFKFYSRRSSYVDFKANVRNRKHVAAWYPRIAEVYGLSIDDRAKGFALKEKADAYYYSRNMENLKNLKRKGVTHFLTKRSHALPPLNPILENEAYVVYDLKDVNL